MNIHGKESQGCLIDFIEMTISSPMAIITQTWGRKKNMVMKYFKFDKILQIPPNAKQQEVEHDLGYVDCLHTFM